MKKYLLSNSSYLFLLRGIFLTALLCSVVSAEPLSAQREKYTDARQALARGDTKTFEYLASQLKDYPLYPYLQYEKLRRQVSVANEKNIRYFLDQYSFLPVANRLRLVWLEALIKRGQHQKFRKYYVEDASTAHDCYYLRALMSANEAEDIAAQAEAFWLAGHSQPDECDPVFSWFESNGHLSNELIWQRIELVMAKNDLPLANYLARKLPEEERAIFKIWASVHHDPAQITRHEKLVEDSEIVRKIIVHGAKRLTRTSVASANSGWQSVKSNYQFSRDQIHAVEAHIALTAALRHDRQAAELMKNLPEDIADTDVQQWRARTAMRDNDWPAVLRSIVLMDEETRATLEWQYWHARALEELGIYVDAKSIYEQVALERDYYGFLAADRAQKPYAMNFRPLQFSDVQIDLLLKHPPLIRARELHLVGQKFAALREWNQMVADLEPLEIQMAAFIAHQWDWYDTAIFTVAKAKHFDDLKLRFPQPFDNLVFDNAKKFSVDPEYIYGVIRQESAFNTGAHSGAGARGLMQLMPATAKDVARSLKKKAPSRNSLLQPTLNVELGSKYLRQMLDRYDNQQALAAAAYNAGPHRVKRWLPEDEKMSADVWVDTIPFNETRKYVRRVMDYSTVYQWKIAQETTRLQTRMPPVPFK